MRTALLHVKFSSYEGSPPRVLRFVVQLLAISFVYLYIICIHIVAFISGQIGFLHVIQYILKVVLGGCWQFVLGVDNPQVVYFEVGYDTKGVPLRYSPMYLKNLCPRRHPLAVLNSGNMMQNVVLNSTIPYNILCMRRAIMRPEYK